jgi:hypothetical protein
MRRRRGLEERVLIYVLCFVAIVATYGKRRVDARENVHGPHRQFIAPCKLNARCFIILDHKMRY